MNSVKTPKDIAQLTKKEAEDFINSFDYVFLDNDGVTTCGDYYVDGAPSAINELRNIGKQIRFVTNNTFYSVKHFKEIYKSFGIECSESDILTPVGAVISYLKRRHFNKKAYLLTNSNMRTELIQAGVNVVEDKIDYMENLIPLFKKSLDPDVELIISAIDLNINYAKLVRTYLYLKKENVNLLVTAQDRFAPVKPTVTIPTPYIFLETITNTINKTPILIGKPSIEFKNYIFENVEITNPDRVLFVGDMLSVDMIFAKLCGFKKMLVFSGVSKIEDMKNCESDETPDYYADSLKNLYNLLLKIK